MPDDFAKVCSSDDLAEGEIKAFNTGGETVLLARYRDRFYALENVCSHDGAGLSDGDLVDGQIQCPRHGGRFNLKTGEATQMPAIVGIKSYQVEIKGGDIYISLEK